ncbi:hypothetical protein C1646_764227 [Rhizophagus diaphanus]|nr:hypothetical protein C1646_764227 [Rhizophagus diaphanus] [Rhizophagus sp. MUCL 43196]
MATTWPIFIQSFGPVTDIATNRPGSVVNFGHMQNNSPIADLANQTKSQPTSTSNRPDMKRPNNYLIW